MLNVFKKPPKLRIMRVNLSSVFEAVLLVAISILWCELGYYYLVFYINCSNWPGIGDKLTENDQKLTKLLVIADTHIMGSIKSVKIDKLRREWQMKQAFWISRSILQPDVIVFMGDLIDEGSFSRDFEELCDDFDRIFPDDNPNEERIIIAGNHDVGNHNQMRDFPFLLRRFIERFKATPSIGLVQTPKTERLNIVVSNSMSIYNDTCPFCSRSMQALNKLEHFLDEKRKNDPKSFAYPIFLGHIPLFRKNDLRCNYPASLREKVSRDSIEGEDVINKVASGAIVTKLEPRLAVSGHTHMLCITEHLISASDPQSTFEEITISSYNHKYAELRPGFLLLTANSTHVFTKHCNLVEESVIILVYLATLLTVLFRLQYHLFIWHPSKSDDKVALTIQLEVTSYSSQTKDQ